MDEKGELVLDRVKTPGHYGSGNLKAALTESRGRFREKRASGKTSGRIAGDFKRQIWE